MTYLFWCGVAWMAYTYAGYPLLLWAAGQVARVRAARGDDYLPTVSVLVAARNEEQDIGWKIAETLAWDYPSERLNVLVASDESEDRTDDIVRGFGEARVQLVRMERRGGKGRALNRLAALAQGELLFFTDANAHIAAGSLRRMVRHFADERVGCVTGGTEPLAEDRQVINRGAGAYLRFDSVLQRLESAIGSVVACDGAIFCIRRSSFTLLSPELANDLELPLRIRQAGLWTLYEPEAVVSELDTNSPWEEFARRRRICAQGSLALWHLRSTLSGWRVCQVVSHKLLRQLTLAPMVMVLLSSAAMWSRPFFAALLIAQSLFYGAAAYGFAAALRGWKSGRVEAAAFYIVFGSAGAMAGVIDTCRGRRFDIWKTAAQSRGMNAVGAAAPGEER